MNNNFPYVLSDCDGTITYFDFTMEEETIKSIKNYQEKSGGKFSFITGRLDIACRSIYRNLNISSPVISCNGALITHTKTGEILFASYLDPEMCFQMFKIAHENNIDLSCYEPNFMNGTKESRRIMAWKKYSDDLENLEDKIDIKIHDSLLDLAFEIQKGNVKPVELILTIREEQTLEEVNNLIYRPFEDKIDYVNSTPELSNAMNRGINKLSGLKEFAKIMKTDFKEICTFGDQMNDYEMITGVKNGYCMGNGTNEMKAVAFKVIGNISDNGVGKQLERFLNNER